MGQGPMMIESGGSMAPIQAPAVGAPVTPISTDAPPLDQTLNLPTTPQVGSATQAFNPQALPEMTGLLQTDMFPQLKNNQPRNLPASATIPQSSFSLPKSTDAMVKPSVYPMPPKDPPAAKQASWTDVQLRSSSQHDQANAPSSSNLAPKPIRLGSGDKIRSKN